MIGRLPIGITGLAILLLVQTSTGSFARGDARAADGASAHHSVHAGGEDGAGGAADRGRYLVDQRIAVGGRDRRGGGGALLAVFPSAAALVAGAAAALLAAGGACLLRA
jgi:hypothetical protein